MKGASSVLLNMLSIPLWYKPEHVAVNKPEVPCGVFELKHMMDLSVLLFLEAMVYINFEFEPFMIYFCSSTKEKFLELILLFSFMNFLLLHLLDNMN